MLLRLLIDLYAAQNLCEDGGISKDMIRWVYDAEIVGQCPGWVIWGFNPKNPQTSVEGLVIPHLKPVRDKADEARRGEDFFARLDLLAGLGLIEWVPYSSRTIPPQRNLYIPYGIGGSDELDDQLGRAARSAGLALLRDYQEDQVTKQMLVAPVRRHIAKPQMIGIARLKYRPKTKMTAAWLAQMNTKYRDYLEDYEEIVAISK